MNFNPSLQKTTVQTEENALNDNQQVWNDPR